MTFASLAHGVDLVHVPRFREVFEGRPERQVRVFTPGELEDVGDRADPITHLAARFAAKEAVFKALGVGLGGVGIDSRFQDVEVRRAGGPPGVRLSGKLARRAEARGLGGGVLSLSHDGDYALASVLFPGGGAS